MADLSLDLNPAHIGQPTYRDLLVVNGDLVLTSDVDSNGTNPVLQNILQRLRFFLSEWFLDNTQGLPWFQQIFIKNPDQGNIDAVFMNCISGTPGVQQLMSYSFEVDQLARVLTISFRCMTTSGVVNYTGVIPPVTGGQ